jgi:hypothetical protein
MTSRCGAGHDDWIETSKGRRCRTCRNIYNAQYNAQYRGKRQTSTRTATKAPAWGGDKRKPSNNTAGLGPTIAFTRSEIMKARGYDL